MQRGGRLLTFFVVAARFAIGQELWWRLDRAGCWSRLRPCRGASSTGCGAAQRFVRATPPVKRNRERLITLVVKRDREADVCQFSDLYYPSGQRREEVVVPFPLIPSGQGSMY